MSFSFRQTIPTTRASKDDNIFAGRSTLRADEKKKEDGKPKDSALQSYLAKMYGGGDNAKDPDGLSKRKKKKKKSWADASGAIRILDQDVTGFSAQDPNARGLLARRKLEEDEEDDAEDAPTVANPEEAAALMKLVDKVKSGSGWVSAAGAEAEARATGAGSSGRRHDSPDASPPRRGTRQASPDASPPRRRPRHDSPDASPPRRGARQASPDASPPRRRKRHDSPDASPPRRGQKEDASPPRRGARRGQASPDASPPRRRPRHDSPDASPPRRAQQPDASPPRQRRQRHDSPDASPPRRAQQQNAPPPGRKPQPDASPPRRRQRHDSPEAASPPRRQAREDASPPRRRQRHDSPDASPPRRRARSPGPPAGVTGGGGAGPGRPPQPPDRMGDGTATGLVSAQQLARDIQKQREQAEERRRNAEGRGAQTVYRDKATGRIMTAEEALKAKEDERAARKKPSIYDEDQTLEWRGGLAQKREAEERKRAVEEEAAKPFARSDIDDVHDARLKERVRFGDPFAHLARRKQGSAEPAPLTDQYDVDKLSKSGFKIPQEVPPHSWLKRGVAPPANRYNIRPGRHWDGVNRSNGFEDKLFLHQNTRAAKELEARLWSMGDM